MAKRKSVGRYVGYYEELDTVDECDMLEELVWDDSVYEVERIVDARKRNVTIIHYTMYLCVVN